MIEFILNNELVSTDQAAGSSLLDFVRYTNRLTGTKIGCREGDCGACTLLIGELNDTGIAYRTTTSCITPLGNVQGKHVVTIEGLNQPQLTPYQQAMVDSSGSQCGMCTVGFIVSFAGASLDLQVKTYEDLLHAIDGNICRCTGYKSIERAAKVLFQKLNDRPHADYMNWLIEQKYVPNYFKEIPARLRRLDKRKANGSDFILGGGTDVLVQKHDEMAEASVTLVSNRPDLKGIFQVNDSIVVGAATSTTDLMNAPEFLQISANWKTYFELISSTPIRNIATVAGNFVNASPIGDLTAIFIALQSKLIIKSVDGGSRSVLLKDFFLDYKKIDLREREFIDHISVPIPDEGSHFNFEKVSKRRYLDIASVNTGISLTINNDLIEAIHISAGGVGPVPMRLNQVCTFLLGKALVPKSLDAALELVPNDISPISDVRGSAAYKTLLLQQLIRAHFVVLFPEIFSYSAVV